MQAGVTRPPRERQHPTEVQSLSMTLLCSIGVIMLYSLHAKAPPLHQCRAGTLAQILRAQDSGSVMWYTYDGMQWHLSGA